MTLISSWRSPSNIALIKYWGKHGVQLPRNPSLSFTLSACHTDLSMRVIVGAPAPGVAVLYKGEPRPAFEPKIKSFFNRVTDRFDWLANASIVIDSANTFPHGAGIASSASAMSAMALCLMDIHDQIQGTSAGRDPHWWLATSDVARLGSGSACRSLFPVASLWGETDGVAGSSDAQAIPWEHHLAPVFTSYKDTILIVSAGEKSVSSTAGHALMEVLAYADVRYREARKNIHTLIDAMRRDDAMDAFISVCESEALQLHALMMAGPSPFILMEPGSVAIIKDVWRFRKETGIPVCFTLDAGPNVHLLYPAAFSTPVMDWVKTTLVRHCADGLYIEDQAGRGPEPLN